MTLCKAYAALAEGQVHYRVVAGSDAAATPVLFLHQTASSGRMWEKVMALMTDDRSLYAPDTPGFGGSFDPPGVPAMADYARWMLEFLDRLGIGTAHLVGHHTGAAIAMEMAGREPARFASLTLIGPNGLTEAERGALRERLGAPFRPNRSGAYLLKTWEYLRVGGADRDIDLLHAEMIDTLRAWRARPHSYAAVWDQDYRALMPRIACPMLLMSSPDDILYRYFARFCAEFPDASARVLSTGANFQPDLVPGEVAAAIAEHIGRV